MRQLFRFALVGLISNSLAYLLYFLLTHVGMGPKSAMSLVYVICVAQTFFLNRAWTFEHSGKVSSGLIRYVAAYAAGYFLNLVILIVLVDTLGWSHHWVQAGAIIFNATILFVAQKFWVFSSARLPQAG